MYVVMKGVIREDNSIVADCSADTTKLRSDYEKAADEIGVWAGDVFVVWNVGDVHQSQYSKALERAREGCPEHVLVAAGLPKNQTVLLPLHENYRDGRITVEEIYGKQYLD